MARRERGMRFGMIVRLIDVVLIILFGFIAISDIQVKRQIKLPDASEAQIQDQQRELLFVKIVKQQPYRIVRANEVLFSTPSLAILETELVKLVAAAKQSGQSAIVIIDPALNTAMQRTIDVYDLCERNGLAKSINMQI